MHVIARLARGRVLLAVAVSWTVGGVAAAAEPEGGAPTVEVPAPANESGDVSKAECLSRYEEAQVARRERRLLDSRAALRICSRAACPAAIRADCVDWLDQVAHSLPSVVVTARARGADILAVKVFIDGKLATEKLTGFALEVDPGLHKFRFESPPWEVIEREVLAAEGAKDRPIEVEFAPPLPPALLTAHAEPKPFRVERSDYIFGSIAVAGIATAAYFGGTGLYDVHQLDNDCAPFCSRDEVNRVRAKLIIADIGLGVAVVALAVGLYLHGKGAF